MSRSATPARSKAGWEHFPRDADIGVRSPGTSAPLGPDWRHVNRSYGRKLVTA